MQPQGPGIRDNGSDVVAQDLHTISLYLAALQRAQLVTSQRIGPWTYYKRHDGNIEAFFKALQEKI
ncbi:hypothetical protein PSEUDT2_04098 [Stutzerimonas stutzeri]|nr:hypothetical protein PSEUDT2_04098 [Stutzerimonas stutzeri]